MGQFSTFLVTLCSSRASGRWLYFQPQRWPHSHFKGGRARALFAGVSTYSILPLESTASSAVGLILLAAGHSGGWPILRGGAQAPTNVLIRHLMELGGTIVTAHEITQMPRTDLVLGDLTLTTCYDWKI